MCPPISSSPVDVSLTDASTPLNSWEWDFDNDGATDSNDPNPSWTYTSTKRIRFPVKLTVSNGTNSSDLLREDYIEIGPLPNTQADTRRLILGGIPGDLARVDTTFYVYNSGRGADSVFTSIGNYGGADSNSVLVSPDAFELAAGDSIGVKFTIFPPLLTPGSYVTQIRIGSKFNPDVQQFDKTIIVTISTPTSVTPAHGDLPIEFSLKQNYPNPFNASTLIRFDLPSNANAVLKIYNIRGQEIKTLVNGEQMAGRQSVRWDGKNAAGQPVSSGVYIYRIEAGRFSQTQKLILLQ